MSSHFGFEKLILVGVYSWELVLDMLSWRKAKIYSASFCEGADTSFFSCFFLS